MTGGGGNNSDIISYKDNGQNDFTSIIYSNCDAKLKHSESRNLPPKLQTEGWKR